MERPLGPRELRVGAFVIAAVVLFIALMGVVSGAMLQRQRESHTLRFDQNVKGMVVGSRVNFQGVPIGAVTDLRFDAGSTLVEIEVDPAKAALQTATRARLDRAIVTGQVTIELEGFAPDGRPLPPGAAIPVDPSPMQALATDLPDMAASGGRALHAAERVLDRAAALLDDDNRALVHSLLQGLERSATALPERLARVEREALATLGEARTTLRAAREAVQEVSPEVTATTGELRRTLGRAEAALAAVEQAAGGVEVLRRDLEQVAGEATRLLSHNQQSVRSLLAEARDALRALRGLARQLREAPSSLLFGAERAELVVPPRGREER